MLAKQRSTPSTVTTTGTGRPARLGVVAAALQDRAAERLLAGKRRTPPETPMVKLDWGTIETYETSKLAAEADLAAAKAKSSLPRKRPNYNNTFRRLNMKMIRRLSQLALFSGNLVCLVVLPSALWIGEPIMNDVLCRLRYKANGRSRVRVDRLVQRPTCNCSRGTCFEQFVKEKEDLVQFLARLWAFSKVQQDALVTTSDVSLSHRHMS